MDIYKWAKENDADYMDGFGNIYKVQNYKHALKLGFPVEGILVYDAFGRYLGIAEKIEEDLDNVES